MDPSSSDKPVSTAITKDATEALPPIRWISPGGGREAVTQQNQRAQRHQNLGEAV